MNPSQQAQAQQGAGFTRTSPQSSGPVTPGGRRRTNTIGSRTSVNYSENGMSVE